MISMRKSVLALFLGLCCLPALAVQASFPAPQVADDLKLRLETSTAATLRAGDITLHSPEIVSQFYAERGYQPAWVDAAGPLPVADQLLNAVREADREGLRPDDYHKNPLSDAITIARTGQPSPRQLSDLDLLLTDAFLTYGTHLVSGRLNPKSIHSDWSQAPRSKALIPLLQTALQSGKIAETLTSLAPPHSGYARLRTALYNYRLLAQNGGWPQVSAGEKLMPGMNNARVRELRARLWVSGDLKTPPHSMTDPAYDNDKIYDDTLLQAVRHFQHRHGLADDGVIGAQTLTELNVTAEERVRQIEMNLERWRWLPEDFGQRYIMVNITNFEMAVVEGDQPVLEASVVVGTTERPTPVFTGNMSYIVLNPYWHVPRSIAVKDKLPQLRRDPYALKRQGIRVFDTVNGGEINPGRVNWSQVSSRNFHYQLRQDPGPGNALGRIKFMFPNEHNVYLHDTPKRGLFSRNQRTYSSGCVRVSKPIELAEYLLKSTSWNRDTIQAAWSSGKKERSVRLPEEIPVHILYWTSWTDEDGTVHFREDIYQHDKPLKQALYSI